MSQPKLIVYSRWSDPSQSKGTSGARQRAALERYAATHGLDLETAEYFSDEGVSGFRGRNVQHGALGRVLAMVALGEIPRGTVLVLENIDRLTRMDPQDAIDLLMDITRAGLVLVTLEPFREISREKLRAGPYMLYELIGSMQRAHEESARKSSLISGAYHARRNAVRSGKTQEKLSSRGPAWLTLAPDRKHWVVDKQRAAVVRRVYEMFAAGKGVRAICTTLNEQGVKPFGKSWKTGKTAGYFDASTVVKYLDSIAPVGDFQPHRVTYEERQQKDGSMKLVKVMTDLEVIHSYFPAIVSKELDAQVKLLRKSTGGVRGKVKTTANVFAGIGVCPECGGGVVRWSGSTTLGGGKRQTIHFLQCRNAKVGGAKVCSNRARLDYPDAETALVREAWRIVENVPSPVDLSRELADAQGLVERRHEEIERVLDAIQESPASAPLRDRLAKLQGYLKTADEQVATLSARQTAGAGKLVEQRVYELHAVLTAPVLDAESVNAALRGLFERVVIDTEGGNLGLVWHHAPEEPLGIRVYPFGRG